MSGYETPLFDLPKPPAPARHRAESVLPGFARPPIREDEPGERGDRPTPAGPASPAPAAFVPKDPAAMLDGLNPAQREAVVHAGSPDRKSVV